RAMNFAQRLIIKSVSNPIHRKVYASLHRWHIHRPILCIVRLAFFVRQDIPIQDNFVSRCCLTGSTIGRSFRLVGKATAGTAPQHAEGTHQQHTAGHHHRHHSCHLRVAFSTN
ncbi:hypothetical protein TcCL_ESM04929, partial [Trypanosoma cruzi]